ncbi:MAG: DNA replication/repair protein RecF [Erysipelotrichaceae bacterium]|nr:DNA replication/repair protein RecF [Erysipelotrichaceae bacterium]
MQVDRLVLRFYRNYERCDVTLYPGINLLIGENGQGKTNLLESVYFLSCAKSHRGVEDLSLIQDGNEFASIDSSLISNGSKKRISALIHKKGKSLCLNNEPVKKTSEFIGKLNAVLFSPADMNLFDFSPKYRRKFMDMELGKMSVSYINQLNDYMKLLKERNAILKLPHPDPVLLDTLTEQMIDPQVQIMKKRHLFVEHLNKNLTKVFQSLSMTDHVISLQYMTFVKYDADDLVIRRNIEEKFEQTKERDCMTHMTNSGIQREDIMILMDGHPVSEYASQGQKRMIIISLKIALVQLIKEYIGEYPVLLLDDVFSELDHRRRVNLLRLLPGQIQTIITTTEADELVERLAAHIHVYEIKEGVVEPWNYQKKS